MLNNILTEHGNESYWFDNCAIQQVIEDPQ